MVTIFGYDVNMITKVDRKFPDQNFVSFLSQRVLPSCNFFYEEITSFLKKSSDLKRKISLKVD